MFKVNWFIQNPEMAQKVHIWTYVHDVQIRSPVPFNINALIAHGYWDKTFRRRIFPAKPFNSQECLWLYGSIIKLLMARSPHFSKASAIECSDFDRRPYMTKGEKLSMTSGSTLRANEKIRS